MIVDIEQLYKAHFEELHRYAFTILRDTYLAEDVVQECFIALSIEIDKGNKILNPRAYLYKMTYNKSLLYIKQNQQNTNFDSVPNTKDPTSNRLESLIDSEKKKEKEQIMEHILALMPSQCKSVFLKSKLEQKKYREIAVEMNLSEKTVEAHMSKALKIIKEYIRVNGLSFALIISIINNEWI